MAATGTPRLTVGTGVHSIPVARKARSYMHAPWCVLIARMARSCMHATWCVLVARKARSYDG